MYKNLLIALIILLVFQCLNNKIVSSDNPSYKRTKIGFLFIGNSNMEGNCAENDTIIDLHTWIYDANRKFYHPVDPINPKYSSGSPIIPFLKKLASIYPEYDFAALKFTFRGGTLKDNMLPGTEGYSSTLAMIKSITDSMEIGGVLSTFGWAEGIDSNYSNSLCVNALAMITQLRKDLQSPLLPLIFGQYEYFADTVDGTGVYKYRKNVIEQIGKLPYSDNIQRTSLTPDKYVPSSMYCDDHHYNAEGYKLWANTAARMIYDRNWDFWKKDTSVPLIIHTPSGHEQYVCQDSIYISWYVDIKKISNLLVEISFNHGKTWQRISGASAINVQKNYMWWHPNNIGRQDSVLIRLQDYDRRYNFESEFFSVIDTCF